MWALAGHLRLIGGELEGARDAYETVLAMEGEGGAGGAGGGGAGGVGGGGAGGGGGEDGASELLAVYLRLGSLYVTEGLYEDAKYVYLQASRLSPSAFTWLGVGVSCYRLEELEQAEDALAEANILNNFDADVWGYLTLVCLQTGRVTEGDQAFMQALKLDLTNGSLLTEIGEAYAAVDRYADAEQCLRRSIELEESAHAHRVLAGVLNAQGQKEGAVAEYMMVLASAEEEEDLDASRAGLVDVLERLGRSEQAAFYRNEIAVVEAERERVRVEEVRRERDEKVVLEAEFR